MSQRIEIAREDKGEALKERMEYSAKQQSERVASTSMT